MGNIEAGGKQPPKYSPYPQWGIEEPRREWNGHSYYRHGVKDPLDRYLITPKPTPLLEKGLTVLDVMVGIGVGALMALLFFFASDFMGEAFDRCADKLGW